MVGGKNPSTLSARRGSGEMHQVPFFLAAKKMCSFCFGYVTGAMLLWMFFQCFTMYFCAQVLVVPFALANRWSVEEGHRDVLLRQQLFSVAGT